MKSILLVKKFLGLVEMTSGLINASFSLPEWQAVKMISLHPDLVYTPKFCTPLSSVSLGTTVIPRRNWKKLLCKILEVNNVYYGRSENNKLSSQPPLIGHLWKFSSAVFEYYI